MHLSYDYHITSIMGTADIFVRDSKFTKDLRNKKKGLPQSEKGYHKDNKPLPLTYGEKYPPYIVKKVPITW